MVVMKLFCQFFYLSNVNGVYIHGIHYQDRQLGWTNLCFDFKF